MNFLDHRDFLYFDASIDSLALQLVSRASLGLQLFSLDLKGFQLIYRDSMMLQLIHRLFNSSIENRGPSAQLQRLDGPSVVF